eukprot:scaffold2329_cov247-Pinguiococcus_pyrenoidosus.AAC.4
MVFLLRSIRRKECQACFENSAAMLCEVLEVPFHGTPEPATLPNRLPDHNAATDAQGFARMTLRNSASRFSRRLQDPLARWSRGPSERPRCMPCGPQRLAFAATGKP